MKKNKLDLAVCTMVTRQRETRSLTGQEAVQLHQELEVGIVALGRLAVGAAHVVAVEIDTCKRQEFPRQPFGSCMLKKSWQHSRRWKRGLSTIDSPSLSPDSPALAMEEHSRKLAAPHVRRDRSKTIVHLHTKAD